MRRQRRCLGVARRLGGVLKRVRHLQNRQSQEGANAHRRVPFFVLMLVSIAHTVERPTARC